MCLEKMRKDEKKGGEEKENQLKRRTISRLFMTRGPEGEE
jgi:hypothetical protein